MNYLIYVFTLFLFLSHEIAQASSFKKDPVPGTPFFRFSLQDSFGRNITYYRTVALNKKLPLAMFIQGSGCTSVFRRKDDGAITGGYQSVLNAVAKGRMNVMVVEKPEVQFLDFNDRPGQAIDCTERFNEEHTLDRWAEALNAALNGALSTDDVDATRVLVVGHSEGAISAAKLASNNKKVTHIGFLSGSGPTQLFDFVRQAQSETEVNSIYEQFRKIIKAPNESKQFVWGHPFKRWASFMTQTSTELLDRTEAKLFIVHGTKDQAVPIESFDSLTTDLFRKQRSFEMMRLEGANHSLNTPEQTPPAGMQEVMEHLIVWAVGK